jgi:hypothetical protein
MLAPSIPPPAGDPVARLTDHPKQKISAVAIQFAAPLNETHREHISRTSPRLSACVCVSFCQLLPATAEKRP